MSCSRCCCCNLRGGMIAGVTSVAVVSLTNCTIILQAYLHEVIQYLPWLGAELLYWAPILSWTISAVTVIVGMACISMPVGPGKHTFARLYIALALVTGLTWLVYGCHFAFRIQRFYTLLLPGNYIVMEGDPLDPTEQPVKKGAKMITAAFANSMMENMATANVLPAPIDIIYYCGSRIHLIVIPFGILPLCVCLANMPYAHSYASKPNLQDKPPAMEVGAGPFPIAQMYSMLAVMGQSAARLKT